MIVMELDNKEKVLVGIYTEYQKDEFNMDSIKAKDLGLSLEAFGNSVIKLENERYITGSKVTKGGTNQAIQIVNLCSVFITPTGIEYVEKKLQINNTDSNKGKAEKVKSKLAEIAWDKGADFAAKVVAEILTKQAGL